MSDSKRNEAPAGVLKGTTDRFGGMNVPAKNLPDNDHDFAQQIHGALAVTPFLGFYVLPSLVF